MPCITPHDSMYGDNGDLNEDPTLEHDHTAIVRSPHSVGCDSDEEEECSKAVCNWYQRVGWVSHLAVRVVG